MNETVKFVTELSLLLFDNPNVLINTVDDDDKRDHCTICKYNHDNMRTPIHERDTYCYMFENHIKNCQKWR